MLEPSYDLYKYARLPYSCTHCGSCGDVCPVKVPIPGLVFYWRGEVVGHGYGQFTNNVEEDLAEPLLKNSTNLAMAEKIGLWALRNIPEKIMESPINPWAKEHDDPVPPAETFRQYYNRVIKPGEDNAGKPESGSSENSSTPQK